MNSADVRHAWVTIMMLLLSDLGWRWVGITGIIACHPRTTEGPLVFGLFYTVASYKRLNTELRSVDGEPSSQWLRKRSAVTEAAPSHCTAPSTVPQRPCLSNRPCVYQALPIFKSAWTLLCWLKCYDFLDLSPQNRWPGYLPVQVSAFP